MRLRVWPCCLRYQIPCNLWRQTSSAALDPLRGLHLIAQLTRPSPLKITTYSILKKEWEYVYAIFIYRRNTNQNQIIIINILRIHIDIGYLY